MQVVNITLDRENRILGLPRLRFEDKGSYVESSTKEYDQLAFKYLSWACYPLLIGYAVYSLLYQEHKGWYSWLLNMIYGFLLTFGKTPHFSSQTLPKKLLILIFCLKGSSSRAFI